ncbi:LysM peptidoglycan-binding domain-containing protein [Prolixibacteraceae bacterium JC049]|nr:LysM peptidoglycan-binding domain-containing protein [Prolixibacteraceae bacterium JC049]
MRFFILLISLLITIQFTGLAQDIVLINGKKYILHMVQEGETIESISKKYQISKRDLKRSNRQIAYRFTEGDMLKIPVAKQKKKEAIEVPSVESTSPQEIVTPEEVKDTENFIYHRLVQGETIYHLSKKYNCSLKAILQANGLTDMNVAFDTELRIPKYDTTTLELNSDSTIFEYLVETGDTYFSLKQRFNVTAEELQSQNPVLKEGLKAGVTLQIPNRLKSNYKVEVDTTSQWIKHIVEKGETLYGLSSSYGVQIPDLKQLNPALRSRGPIIGEELLIKSQPDTTVVLTDSIVAPSIEITPIDTVKTCPEWEVANDTSDVKIGVLLPLFLNMNDTINMERVPREELDSLQALNPLDTLQLDSIRFKEHKQVYGGTRNFLHFYEGFLLAVEQSKNKNLTSELYDTDKSGIRVDTLLRNGTIDSLDLIVGPVYSYCQKPVLAYARQNNIPMISPLSGSDKLTKQYNQMIQINPTPEYQTQETVRLLAEKYFDKNIVVLRMPQTSDSENKAIELLREKVFSTGQQANDPLISFHDYDYTVDGFDGLRYMFRKDVENVVFISSGNRAQVSIAINSLTSLTEEFSITLVGRSNYPRFTNIQVESFHKLKLNFLTPYHIDYESKVVNDFIRNYREKYATEPDQFSYQGYDIGVYFIQLIEKYGANFMQHIDQTSVRNQLTQSDYFFRKITENSGWMNQTLYDIQYTPEFDIISNGRFRGAF